MDDYKPKTIHRVEVAITRYYYVYVVDDNNVMTAREAEDVARDMIVAHGDDVLQLDDDINIEPQDIISAQLNYSFNDV